MSVDEKAKAWLENNVEIYTIDEFEAWIGGYTEGGRELEEGVRELKEAVEEYMERGHHDTCDHSLSLEYECNCGYDNVRKALHPEKGGE